MWSNVPLAESVISFSSRIREALSLMISWAVLPGLSSIWLSRLASCFLTVAVVALSHALLWLILVEIYLQNPRFFLVILEAVIGLGLLTPLMILGGAVAGVLASPDRYYLLVNRTHHDPDKSGSNWISDESIGIYSVEDDSWSTHTFEQLDVPGSGVQWVGNETLLVNRSGYLGLFNLTDGTTRHLIGRP